MECFLRGEVDSRLILSPNLSKCAISFIVPSTLLRMMMMMISSCTTLYSCLHQILHDIVNRRSERTPSAVLMMMMMTMASNHHHHHCHHNNCHHHDDHHHRHDDDDHRHQRLFTMKHQGVKLPMRRLERKSRGKVSEVINEKRHKVSTPNGNVKKCQH